MNKRERQTLMDQIEPRVSATGRHWRADRSAREGSIAVQARLFGLAFFKKTRHHGSNYQSKISEEDLLHHV